MAVAHDTSTRFPATDNDGGDTTTGDRTFSHAGSASAKGAVVVLSAAGTASTVTGVLYGGRAMTLVVAANDTVEPGSVDIYFLDDLSGITGTQTVTLQGCTATAKYAVCSTVTAGTAQTRMVGYGKVETTTSTNPTVTFDLATGGMVYGGVHGGAAAPTSYAAGTDETIQFGADYGTKSARTERSTAVASAGAYTYNFVFGTSDDWCIAAVAIVEATPVTLRHRYEGTDEAAITVPDTSDASDSDEFTNVTGTVVFDTAFAVNGSSAMRASVAATSSSSTEWNRALFGSPSTWYGRFYYRMPATALPAAVRFYQVDSEWGIGIDSATGELIVRDLDAGANRLTLAAPATETWHRCEFKAVWDGTNITVEVKSFRGANLHGTTPDESGTSTAFAVATVPGLHRWGIRFAAAQTWEAWIDESALSTVDWIGSVFPAAQRQPHFNSPYMGRW